MSINQLNAFIKSGEIELTDTIPFVHPNIINSRGVKYAHNMKVDYYEQIETAISFRKKLSKPINRLEDILKTLNKINGKIVPN
jgi:hypothetical protein